MAGDLPSRRIDRDALERIIQRAAELQAGEMDTGEGMTEAELLKLGAEVGIDGRFLRQALYEESAGAAAGEKGLVAKWVGQRLVRAARVVPGDKPTIERALADWMTDGEALAVKRRLPDRTIWERQKGFFAEMKRGLNVGGKNFRLARAHDVTVCVQPLEEGYCHVEMTADISNLRASLLGAGWTMLGTSGLIALSVAFFATASMAWVALLPVAAGVAAVGSLPKRYARASERMQLALEQVLDRLEGGEIKPRHQLAGPRGSAFVRIADEIRKAIAEISEPTRQPPRGLPPTT